MKRKQQNSLPEIHYVEFHDTTLQTVMEDGIQYVVMKRIVEGIGLNWSAQQQKLLAEKERFSCMDINTTGSDGKKYHMLCIPLTKLNGWLFSINPSKISNPETRNRITLYQEESFIALYNYWQKGAAINSRIFGENANIGLLDESAKTTNNINYAINGLCKTADQFLGGKAALTALNYFTGMPIDHLLKDLEEKQKEKTEKEMSSGQKMKIPQNVRDFIDLMCEFSKESEIKKDDLYIAYSVFCKENMTRPEARTNFFRFLLNMKRLVYIHRRGKDGVRFWTVTGICLKTDIELAEV